MHPLTLLHSLHSHAHLTSVLEPRIMVMTRRRFLQHAIACPVFSYAQSALMGSARSEWTSNTRARTSRPRISQSDSRATMLSSLARSQDISFGTPLTARAASGKCFLSYTTWRAYRTSVCSKSGVPTLFLSLDLLTLQRHSNVSNLNSKRTISNSG